LSLSVVYVVILITGALIDIRRRCRSINTHRSLLITGVVGNLATCVVIVWNAHMHTATNYYLFSLAISDTITLVLGMRPLPLLCRNVRFSAPGDGSNEVIPQQKRPLSSRKSRHIGIIKMLKQIPTNTAKVCCNRILLAWSVHLAQFITH